MVHKIKDIANNRRFDPNLFEQFCLDKENYNKFGIFVEYGFVSTTTWYTNELIDAFNKFLNKNL